jgi:hypothetical protein
MSAFEWDARLTRTSNKAGTVQVAIPAVVARELVSAGYNMCRCSITPEGILLKPYRGESGRFKQRIELPEWKDVDEEEK